MTYYLGRQSNVNLVLTITPDSKDEESERLSAAILAAMSVHVHTGRDKQVSAIVIDIATDTKEFIAQMCAVRFNSVTRASLRCNDAPSIIRIIESLISDNSGLMCQLGRNGEWEKMTEQTLIDTCQKIRDTIGNLVGLASPFACEVISEIP